MKKKMMDGGAAMKKGGKACYAMGGAGKINHEEMTPKGKPMGLKAGKQVKKKK